MVGFLGAEVVDLGMAASTAAGVVGGRWTSGSHAVGAGRGVGRLGGTFPGGLFGVDLKGGWGGQYVCEVDRQKVQMEEMSCF